MRSFLFFVSYFWYLKLELTGGSARGAARLSPARPASTARSVKPTATTGDLLGLSAADLQNMLDDDNDASFLNQVLQNPTMIQMMHNVMSNMNPNVRNIVESNIPLRKIFENPEFFCQLTSPETM
jgi:ubiquilin